MPIKHKRVKTPVVLQMEAVECGAAALAIVLQYFGKIIPLETLRVDCGVSRDGSKASNIVKIGRKYGLEVQGYRKEPEQLKEMPLPMVIHWNFNHFLVVEGFKKDRVYLNDPASGPRIVSEEEFDQSFTGVVITFKKGESFVPSGEKPSMLAALRSRLVGSERALLFAVLAGLVLAIPGLAIPVFTQVFIDDILLGKMEHWLMPLVFGLLATALIRIGLTWLQQYYLLLLETKLTLTTSSRFFWHILRLPVEFYMQRFGGEIGSRVMINDTVAKVVSRDLVVTLLNLVMMIFYFVLMLQYNVLLTLVGVASAMLNVIYLRLISQKRVDQNQKLLQERGKLYGISMAGLQIMETLKAGGIESDFFSVWSGTQAKVMNSEQQFETSSIYLLSVPGFLTALNMAVIIAVGGLAVLDGNLTIGMLVAFQFLMSGFIAPVNELVNMGSKLQELEGDLNRLDDVLRHPVDKQFQANREDELEDKKEDSFDRSVLQLKPKLAGYVELKNVDFGYSKLEPPLIEKFSLTLKPGERVALVGGSGSGKSTLAKLIAGIFTPWSGEILFDEKPRGSIPPAILYNSLAVVDQEISVFEGTVRDNLTLWDDTKKENVIVKAAKDACVHDIILERQGDYNHLLAEGGRNFSGGQLQRIEIARALVTNPTILILDEATSALDAKTELEVSEDIRRRGCTTIIVAHRLSTIRDCDEIIVLSKGKVSERGTHEELKKIDGGLYAGLISDL